MPDQLKVHIVKAGLQTLMQDEGRTGWQQCGVPRGGAMDNLSYRLANWLVGNPRSNPILEITLLGPLIEFDADCVFAVTGADLNPSLDNNPIPIGRSLLAKAGSSLRFGKASWGCRAYLAIRGEWLVNTWLGSFSVLSGIEDILPDNQIHNGCSFAVNTRPEFESRSLEEDMFSIEDEPIDYRVVPGPEMKYFSAQSIEDFFSRSFTISKEANRMGYRLEGTLSGYEQDTELISTGVVPGTIQVTRSGQPIIMQADGQTSGGYYRFANVISADMHLLAQCKPGDQIAFELISLEEAEKAKRSFYHKWKFLYT